MKIFFDWFSFYGFKLGLNCRVCNTGTQNQCKKLNGSRLIEEGTIVPNCHGSCVLSWYKNGKTGKKIVRRYCSKKATIGIERCDYNLSPKLGKTCWCKTNCCNGKFDEKCLSGGGTVSMSIFWMSVITGLHFFSWTF